MSDSLPGDISGLLISAKQGCLYSTNQLLHQYRGYLCSLSHNHLDRRLRRKHDNSDVAQRTLVRASEMLSTFRGANRHEFRAWLRRILINEVHYIRRWFGRHRRNSTREQALETVDSLSSGLAETRDLTPQAAVSREEDIMLVRKSLATLPPLDQTVIRLRNWEQLPYSAIAQRLNKSEAAVKKIWQRAVQKLSKIIRRNKTPGG